jgi:solute:Na+ symporter, SSS family
MPQDLTASPGFELLDWAVVLAVLVLTTWIGHRAAGRPSSAREFFLGGRRLPWYAVAASLIATEISAVTFIGLPASVAADGGDLTYLQVVLFGALITRGIVAFVLVPVYFEREIYSPYDFVGQRLGGSARAVTTAVFSIGGVLAQGARVYLTAMVLEVLLKSQLDQVHAAIGMPPLVTAVAMVGLVAVVWTWMGGIATVVWTDVVLFVLFLVGIAVLAVVLNGAIDGGLVQAFHDGSAAGKTRMIDSGFAWKRPHTLGVVLGLASWGMVGDYGCNQLLVQRLLCCSSVAQARLAVLVSSVGALVIAAIAFLGIGLWCWTETHAFVPQLQVMVDQNADRLLPAFLLQEVPAGWKGLVLAGVFAAAISSLDSILAALSQTTMSLFGLDSNGGRGAVRASRILVVVFAVLLCAVAIQIRPLHEEHPSILTLALKIGALASGVLLGAFVLALSRWRLQGDGLVWAAPVALVWLLSIAQLESLLPSHFAMAGGAIALCFLFLTRCRGFTRTHLAQVALLLGMALGAAWIRQDLQVQLPWPWYAPIGSVLTVALSWSLDRARTQADDDAANGSAANIASSV